MSSTRATESNKEKGDKKTVIYLGVGETVKLISKLEIYKM